MKKKFWIMFSSLVCITILNSSCKKKEDAKPEIAKYSNQGLNMNDSPGATTFGTIPDTVMILGTWRIIEYNYFLGYTFDTTWLNKPEILRGKEKISNFMYLYLGKGNQYYYLNNGTNGSNESYNQGTYDFSSIGTYTPFSSSGYIPKVLRFTEKYFRGEGQSNFFNMINDGWVSKLTKNEMVLARFESLDCAGGQSSCSLYHLIKISQKNILQKVALDQKK